MVIVAAVGEGPIHQAVVRDIDQLPAGIIKAARVATESVVVLDRLESWSLPTAGYKRRRDLSKSTSASCSGNIRSADGGVVTPGAALPEVAPCGAGGLVAASNPAIVRCKPVRVRLKVGAVPGGRTFVV